MSKVNAASQQLREQPERRRRKVFRTKTHSRGPLLGRLNLDSHLRGDVGVLADDLVTDLFPSIDLTGVTRKPLLLGLTTELTILNMANNKNLYRSRPK